MLQVLERMIMSRPVDRSLFSALYIHHRYMYNAKVWTDRPRLLIHVNRAKWDVPLCPVPLCPKGSYLYTR